MTLTRELAYAAATDAGNRSMRRAGRAVWNEDDFNSAARELSRIQPRCARCENPAVQTVNTRSFGSERVCQYCAHVLFLDPQTWGVEQPKRQSR